MKFYMEVDGCASFEDFSKNMYQHFSYDANHPISLRVIDKDAKRSVDCLYIEVDWIYDNRDIESILDNMTSVINSQFTMYSTIGVVNIAAMQTREAFPFLTSVVKQLQKLSEGEAK